jgi:hypothetical protein
LAALRWLLAALLVLQWSTGASPVASSAQGSEPATQSNDFSGDGSLLARPLERGVFLQTEQAKEKPRYLTADGGKDFALEANPPSVRAVMALAIQTSQRSSRSILPPAFRPRGPPSAA